MHRCGSRCNAFMHSWNMWRQGKNFRVVIQRSTTQKKRSCHLSANCQLLTVWAMEKPTNQRSRNQERYVLSSGIANVSLDLGERSALMNIQKFAKNSWKMENLNGAAMKKSVPNCTSGCVSYPTGTEHVSMKSVHGDICQKQKGSQLQCETKSNIQPLGSENHQVMEEVNSLVSKPWELSLLF